MQVRHEGCLLEPVTAQSRPKRFAPSESTAKNLLLDLYTLQHRLDYLSPIEYLATNSQSNIVAVYLTGSKQVAIFDTRIANTSKLIERFPLKACDKRFSKQSFDVKGIDFSSDGHRVAIGQTDCIIYIYKLPVLSNLSLDHQSSQPPSVQKPTITGKFVCSSPVTCLIWASCGILFGTQDGKVKLVSFGKRASVAQESNQFLAPSSTNTSTPSNSASQLGAPLSQAKVVSLYNSPKSSMPLVLAFRHSLLLVGFADSSLLALTLPSEFIEPIGNESGSRKNSISAIPSSATIDHSCPPTQISVIQTGGSFLVFCCAGSDGRLVIYRVQWNSDANPKSSNLSIQVSQKIDLNEEILAIDYSQVNEVLSVATVSRLLFVKYDQEMLTWQLQGSFLEITGCHSLTSVKWTRDGSQLVVGTLVGSVELFQCSWSKQALSEQLDICHIAKNRVRITDRARNLLATFKTQSDIKRVHLLDRGRSVIIWGSQSLLLARLGSSNLQSEIQWPRDGKANQNVRFYFDYSGLVLIHNTLQHDLTIIKLGQNSIAFSVKLNPPGMQLNKKRVSVRQFPSPESLNSVDGDPRRSPRRTSMSDAQLNDPNPLPRDLNSDVSQQLESIHERFAYLSDGDTSLILVDLKRGSKEFTMKLSHRVEWLDFSNSCEKLALLSDSGRLSLLTSSDISQWSESFLMEGCEFSRWLPESDILVAQSASRIRIWFMLPRIGNPRDIGVVEDLDSRSFNINGRPPLIDLSLVDKSHRKSFPVLCEVGSDALTLSNGSKIQLDAVKVKFYRDLVKSVRFALETLESASEEQSFGSDSVCTSLWIRLLWYAIDSGDCQAAVQALYKLNYRPSWIDYLKNCMESDEAEREVRLALLRGQWAEFESLAEPDRIHSTYRRLNRWTQLIEYLTRMQQFRQRDLVEKDFRSWLILRGRPLDAARLFIKADDLKGAMELLISNEKWVEAAEILCDESKTIPGSQDLSGVARQLKSKLIDAKELKLAARLCEKVLSQPDEAVKLYLSASCFEPAISIAINNFPPERVDAMRESYASHLLQQFAAKEISRRDTLKAIDQLMMTNRIQRALEVAIELGEFSRAFEILKTLSKVEDPTGDYERPINAASLVIGNNLGVKELEMALEALKFGRHFRRMIELCLECSDYRRAFQISTDLIHNGDRRKALEDFQELAKSLSIEGRNRDAEEIYLHVMDRPDLAIELRHKLKDYDGMFELVSQFEPDQLESRLLIVSRELESAGRLKESERYLLRVSESEWTNVVRMYRLASKWDEAFRVASQYCASSRDPLLVQLAFWWAKSLQDLKSARELLFKLDLFKLVVEFCCENRNFQFALDLCSDISDDETLVDSSMIQKLKGEIIVRQATLLEQQNKFEEAENLLISNGRLKDAVSMYMDNERYTDALRVIDSQIGSNQNPDQSTFSESDGSKDDLASMLNDTLIECARRISGEPGSNSISLRQNEGISDTTNMKPLDQAKLLAVQQMYLRAQRPDLAVQMYQERGLWQEAVQVAQRFAPQLLEQVEQALDKAVNEDLRPIVAKTKPIGKQMMPSTRGNPINIETSDGGSINRTHGYANQEAKQIEQRVKSAISRLGTPNQGSAITDLESIFNSTQLDKSLKPTVEILRPLRQATLEKGLVGSNDRLIEKLLDVSDQMIDTWRWGIPMDTDFAEDLEALSLMRDTLVNFLSSMTADDSRFKDRLIATHLICIQSIMVLNWIAMQNEKSKGRKLVLRKNSHSNRGIQGKTRFLPFHLNVQSASKYLDHTKLSTDQIQILIMIAKLSTSLTNLDTKSAHSFYVAGIWLLVASRPDLTRKLWSRVLEWIDSGKKTVGKQLGSDQVDEMRAWLLEGLMDSGNERLTDSNTRVIEDADLLRGVELSGKISLSNVCLATGLPLDEVSQTIGRMFRVNEADWLKLKRIQAQDKLNKDEKLARAIELINRLITEKS